MTHPRVQLTGIRPEDAEPLFRWINDPETVRFNAPYKPVHWINHEDWLRSLNGDGAAVYAIRTTADDLLIGVAQLVHIDPIHCSAEVRIRIGEEKYRGGGYGTEALRLLVEAAWKQLNLHSVYTYVFADNPRAVKAYQKAGFEIEGTLKQRAHINGRYVDMWILGQVNIS